MLRDVVQLLPPDVSTLVVYLAMAGACAGVGLWMAGARMSRGLITLSLVSAGGLIGLRLPAWLGWQVSGMAMAVGLALVGGLLGFILHRLWVGVGLGLTLGLWAILACWIGMHGDYQPGWEHIDWAAGSAAVWQQLWSDLPANLRKWWPVAGLAGLGGGIVMSLLWPRVAIVTLYSLVGVSMAAGLGLLAVRAGRPEWIDRLPEQRWVQAALFGSLVLLGALVQWKLMPRPASATRATAADDESEDA